MAATDYTQVVQQLYISYFGRPADPSGLANFTAQLLAADPAAGTDAALTTTTALSAYSQAHPTSAVGLLVGSFANKVTPPGNDHISVLKFVNDVYNNIFHRDADAGGNFWVNAIETGAVSRENAALAITEGAMTNTSTQGLADAALVAKVNAVAQDFTSSLDTIPKIISFSGDAAAAAAHGLLAQVTATTDLTAFHANVTLAIGNLIIPVTTSTSLTANVDTFVGTSANDVISATLGTVGTVLATLGAFDAIDGGTGNNTLNISDVKPTDIIDTTAIAGLSVKNVQTVNVQGTDAVTIDTSGWTGVTALNVLASKGVDTITAADATAVNVVDLTGAVTVKGGSAITVSANGNITAGGTSLVATIAAAVTPATQAADVAAAAAAVVAHTAATTAVTHLTALSAAITGATTDAAGLAAIQAATAAAVVTGEITAAQKTAIDAAANNAGATDAGHIAAAQAIVTPIQTAAVAVQTAAATADTAAAAVVTADVAAGNFTVTDTANTALTSASVTGNYSGSTVITDNSASATTLTSVTLNNSGVAALTGDGIATVNVSNGSHNVTITNTTVGHAEALVLNAVTGGIIADGVAKTVNVTTAGVKSSGVTISAGTATALTFADAVNFSGTVTAAAATSLKITGAGTFKAVATGLNAAAVIDATGSTGAVTTTLGAGQTFKGGATSIVTITGDATKAITAGAGVADVLVLNAAAGSFTALNTGANATGFDIIGAGAASTGTYDLSVLTGFKGIDVQSSAGGALVYSNVAAGATLAVDATLANSVTYTLANATGTSDAVSIAVGTAATTGINATAGIIASGIETVTLTSNGDGKTTNLVHLTDAAATKLVLKGAEGINLTGSTLGALTSIDATGIAAKQTVTIDNAATVSTGGVTVTATDANLVFTGTAAAGKVDTITVGNGVANIHEGTGNNVITVGNGDGSSVIATNGNNTIKVGNGVADIVTVGNGNNTITVGNGGSTVSVGGGLNTVTLGNSGLDNVTVTASGANGNVYTTVNGFIKGDSITESHLVGFDAANKVVLAPTAVFQDYLNTAVAAEAQFHATWFQFGGNTYVVEDLSNSGTAFVNGTDIVIQLTGTVDLSGTHAAFASHTITLA